MQSKIKTLLSDLILQAGQVGEAVGQAKLFRSKCRVMRRQVYQLSQMLERLLCLITLDPILLCLNPIHCVISEVSRVLQKALSLACKCKHKTIFCRLSTSTKTKSDFHKLDHLLDACITNMNWLLIIYNPNFNSAFNEIFLSLPEILTNNSSIPSALNCVVTEDTLWELATILTSDNVGIVLNSRMIKEVEVLMLCLAKLMGAEHGELKCNCLMTIMEITAAAESNLDLRLKLFKTNSPGAKAIIEQLLRVIQESQDPTLQILAIKSIGSLARMFIERENHHVINVLVLQLGNEHQEVVIGAVVALTKFVCKDNFLHKAHSKRMIEFNAVQALVKLLRDGERSQQLHGLELICYLAMNADYNEAMEQARVVTAIQQLLTTKRESRRVVSQNPQLKELVPKALEYLTLYYQY
ncbi:hypothetical protein REPUB_Repub01dG0255800 [Reevesia pubescens]